MTYVIVGGPVVMMTQSQAGRSMREVANFIEGDDVLKERLQDLGDLLIGDFFSINPVGETLKPTGEIMVGDQNYKKCWHALQKWLAVKENGGEL